jgi:hypothetical protein
MPPLPERHVIRSRDDHVPQANEEVGLDFQVGRSGSPVPRDNH